MKLNGPPRVTTLRRCMYFLFSAVYAGAATASATQHHMTYDSANRVTQFDIASFGTTTTEYLDTGAVGAMGQPFRVQNADGITEFDYDVYGRATQISDPQGHTFYQYDSKGGVASVIRSSNATIGDSDDRTLQYSYDDRARISQVIYPDGETIQYGYDNATGLLSTLTNVTHNEVLTYNYGPKPGQLASITRNNSAYSVSYVYDTNDRMVKRTYQDDNRTIEFESNINVLGEVDWVKSTLNGVTSMEDYTYNDLSQLTKVVYSADTTIDEATDRVVEYSYDKSDKRLSLLEKTAGVITKHLTYQYNTANQLATIHDELTATDFAVLSYDTAGNLNQKVQAGVTTTYQWFGSGKLKQIATPTQTVSFTYDGLGNRLTKTVNGVTTEFVTEGGTTVQAYQGASLIYSKSATGSTIAGQRVHPISDFTGSIRHVTDGDLNVQQSANYDVYGMPVGNGLNNVPMGYIGEDYDSETGLISLRARYYDPELGIFLRQDPAAFGGGSYMYGYTQGNPTSMVDRNGQNPMMLFSGGSVAGKTDRIQHHWDSDSLYIRSTTNTLNNLPDYGITTMAVGGSLVGADIITDPLSVVYDISKGRFGSAAIGAAFSLVPIIPNPRLSRSRNLYSAGFGKPNTRLPRNYKVQSIPSGTKTVISGHGALIKRSSFRVPQGTNIIFGVPPGSLMTDGLGNAFESGIWDDLPTQIYRPGSLVPNVRIYPPTGLNIRTGSRFVDRYMTVNRPKSLEQLVYGNGLTGNVCVATCLDLGPFHNFRRSVHVPWSGGAGKFRSSNPYSSFHGSSGFGGFFRLGYQSTSWLNNTYGGVVLDGAAQLAEENLQQISGATFDPVSGELIFLEKEGNQTSTPVDLDYFYTAVKNVFGSAKPPAVTLELPAEINSGCVDNFGCVYFTNYSDRDDVFEAGEREGLVFNYTPFWDSEDQFIDVKVKAHETATPNNKHEWTVRLQTFKDCSKYAYGRCKVALGYHSTISAPSFIVPNYFNEYGTTSLSASGQYSRYALIFRHAGGVNLTIDSMVAMPDRLHRQFGGSLEDTRLGWALYEADRVMKALNIGKEELTGSDYDSTTVAVPGFRNGIEIIEDYFNNNPSVLTGASVGRLWFVPDSLKIQRDVNSSGKATMLFNEATVKLNAAAEPGYQPSPNLDSFATHFTANYDKFAELEFPVTDPANNANTIQVKIFAELEKAMEAVALARFIRDNNIPLDMWWMDNYQPKSAQIRKSTQAFVRDTAANGYTYLTVGGADIYKPNEYLAGNDPTAYAVGEAATTNRPNNQANNQGDILDQQGDNWRFTEQGEQYQSLSTDIDASQQANTLQFAHTDVSSHSLLGQFNLTRYYQPQMPDNKTLHKGWMFEPFKLLFSRPAWQDPSGLIKAPDGSKVYADSKGDTKLRSGIVSVLSAKDGIVAQFESSLNVNYDAQTSGNYIVTTTGLNSNKQPDFTEVNTKSGLKLEQTTSRYYRLILPSGEKVEFDDTGLLQGIIGASTTYPSEILYLHDANDRLIYVNDYIQGNYIEVLYENYTDGKVIGVAAPGGQSVSYGYTGDNLTQVTDNVSGKVTQYHYDESGRVIDITFSNGANSGSSVLDNRGRNTRFTDLQGNSYATQYALNLSDASQSIELTNLSNNTNAKQYYDAQQRITKTVSYKGIENQYQYTSGGALPDKIIPGIPNGTHPGYEQQHDVFGQLTSIKDLGNTGANATTQTYDPLTGQMTSQTDVQGNIYTYTYKAIGAAQAISPHQTFIRRAGATTDTLIKEIEYYDTGLQFGLVKWVKDQWGNKLTEYQYTDAGQISQVSDRLGHITKYLYDAANRLHKIQEADYDANGQIIGYVDVLENTYNTQGQRIAASSAGNTTSYTYTANGQLATKTNEMGRVTSYQYDNETGSLTSITRQSTSGNAVTQYVYDRHGVMSIIDPEGFSQRSARDSHGNIVNMQWGYDNDQDGLFDSEEIALGTNPSLTDSDGDGIADGVEQYSYGTSPTSSDSDSDGISDHDEIFIYGSNPINADSDGDGITDHDEINIHNSNPNSNDSDNDGLSDSDEVNLYGSSPSKVDTDDDKLTDNEEVNIYLTNPANANTDGDDMDDGDEVELRRNPIINEIHILLLH